MSWTDLLKNSTEPHRVTGNFQIIKFTPNLVAQETFNIGILFTDNQGQRHVKMLNNAKAFECLYGKAGAMQVQNMLNYAKDIAEQIGDTVIASPHLSYTQPLFTQGLTIEQILSSLQQDYLQLVCEHDKQPSKRQPINTEKLRDKVFKSLRQANPQGFESVLHNTPILIPDHNQTIEVDMPIWKETDDLLGKSHYFATIVSADFVTEAYLGYNLDTLGAMNIQTACETRGHHSRAGFFIYCPTPDHSDISELEYFNINKHIQKTMKNVKYVASRTNTPLKFELSDNLYKLKNEILNFTTA